MTTVTDQAAPVADRPVDAPVGVLDQAHGLVYPGGSYPHLPTTLNAAGQMAQRAGLRQLWVHPSAMASMGLPTGPGPWYHLKPDQSLSHPFTDHCGPWTVGTRGAGLRAGFSCWVAGTDASLEVFLLEWEPPARRDGPRGGVWGGCDDGLELLYEIDRWHRATRGAGWHRSGAITSEAWLREHYRRKRGHLGPTTVPEPGAGEVEADITWHRAPHQLIEKRGPHCHAFDLNAMYLSAASSLPLPVGEPEYHDSTRWGALELQEAFRRPGYWLVTWGPQGPDDVPAGGGEPHLDNLRRGWVTAPTMHYLHDAGLFVGTSEGWSWPESHRFLEPWYRMLRDARLELLAGGPALDAVKATYRQGIGRLGSSRRARGDADPLHQPYWRQAVIAEARTRLLRRLAKLRQGPVAVDVDCAWFLTNTAEPHRFAQRAGLPLGDGLGQFHHRGSCTGAVARAALELPDHHAAIDALREAT